MEYRIYVVSVLISFAFMRVSCADNGTDVANSIYGVFDQWSSVGVLNGSVKAKKIKVNALMGINLFVPGTSNDYHRLPEKAVAFPIKVPLLSSHTDAVPVMTELNQQIAKSCQDSGGQLETMDNYKPSGSVKIYLVDDMRRLREKKLVGDFVCRSNDGTKFQVKIWPTEDAESGLVSLKWNIYAYLVGREVFANLEQRVASDAASYTEAISNLKPGMRVAIPATSVPKSLLKDVPDADVVAQYADTSKYKVCALLIEEKPALVQVQVGSGTLFIPKSDITPFKKQISVGSGIPIGNWSDWCI